MIRVAAVGDIHVGSDSVCPLGTEPERVVDVPLAVTAVSPQVEPPGLPFAFDIAVGVRKGDAQLKDELNAVLARRRPQIERILDQYGIPRAAPLSPQRPVPTGAARGESASAR